MSDSKDFEARRRAELIKAATLALGLASQAMLALSGAARRTALAFQDLITQLEEQEATQPPDPTGGPTGPVTGATGPTGPPVNP